MTIPNLKKIELCVTYRCNLACANCSNLCAQAPAKHDLSVEDVERFIIDSIDLGWEWEQITVHGGEPVLNPAIFDIVGVLVEYREHRKRKVRIQFLTNYSTPMIRKLANEVELMGVELGIAQKEGGAFYHDGSAIPYVPVNQSPEDLHLPWSRGCFQSSDCGICLNYLGYWECSPAAAAARVFGYKASAKSLQEVTEDVLAGGYDEHCRHCGFAASQSRVTRQSTTETWDKALSEYRLGKRQ